MFRDILKLIKFILLMVLGHANRRKQSMKRTITILVLCCAIVGTMSQMGRTQGGDASVCLYGGAYLALGWFKIIEASAENTEMCKTNGMFSVIPFEVGTDWGVFPFMLTWGPIGIKTAVIEGYGWDNVEKVVSYVERNRYYSCLPVYLYIDPLYWNKSVNIEKKIVSWQPYIYAGGSHWANKYYWVKYSDGEIIKGYTIENIFEAGVGLTAISAIDVHYAYRKASWKDKPEHLIRVNVRPGVLIAYGVKPRSMFRPQLWGTLAIQGLLPENTLHAGEKAQLTVRLENRGNKSASDIALDLDFEDYKQYLNVPRIEKIKKLKPGEQKVIQVPIQASTLMPTGTVYLALTGRDKNRNLVYGKSLNIQTRERLYPADLLTNVTFSDEAAFIPNRSLDATERAQLTVTVRNNGKGMGFDVKLKIHSDNPDVTVEDTKSLGNLTPNEEKTVTIPLQTILQAKDGFVNILVETKEKRGFDAQKQQIRIPVVHLSAPKLEIASVELNDRKLGRAQGNGNGIPENDETIELIAFIKNSGVGDAIAAKLELVEINSGLSVLERAMDLGTIRPNQTVKGTLLFHIPRTFSAEQLKYQLRVSEIRSVGTAEKTETIAMGAQQPILAYSIKPPDILHNGEQAAFEVIPKNQGLLDAKGVSMRLSASGASITPETFEIGDIPAGTAGLARRVIVGLPRTYSQKQLTLHIHITQSDFPAKSGAETYPVELLAPEFTVTDRFVDQNGNQVIEQGERVEVELTVTNRGRLEAQNVRLSVSTSIPDVRIAELPKLVGTLPPNTTSDPVKFIFTLPRAGEAGDFPIAVTINQADFASVTHRLNYTIASASPILGITAQFVDEDKDGRIEQGENIDVAVTVTNAGKQDALNTKVQLSTTIPNVVIAQSIQSIDTLSPNKSETAKFSVTIPRGVPAGAFPLEVKVTHAEFAPVVKTLNYTIYEAGVATTVVEAKKPSETPQPEAFRGNQPPTILPNVTDNQTVYTANFVLQASVSDDRLISSVIVMLNGAKVYDFQTDLTAADKLRASGGKLLNFEQKVTLQAGVNKLALVARDSDNETKRLELHVTYEKPTSTIAELDNPSDIDVDIPITGMSNPDAIAVVIGNYDYDYFPKVDYAIRDAQAMREYLIKMLGYRPENVILVENATTGRFNELFGLSSDPEGELYNRVKQGSSDVFIYYSGHGLPAPKGQQHGYMVPIDCQERNFRLSGYSMETFYQNVNQIPARNITIVLDACFSGKSVGGNLITQVSGGPGTMTSPIYNDSNNPLRRSDVLIFASANGDEWSNWHSEKRHGLFTYFFLKGLRGEADKNGDKEISASEIDLYIRDKSTGIPYYAKLAGKEQTPVTMGDTARVVVRLKY